MEMRCPACQTENRPGIKFCEECGARLEATCPACGAPVPPDKKFCGHCGAPLTGATGREGPSSTTVTTTGLRESPPPRAPATGTPIGERFESPQAYTPAHLAERILKDRGALSGERKQVTVLFADVSGFTAISERLDPEDVHALINRGFELMLAEIHRYEGTVNQFLGDGLMALFGAPVAHEDHAQRAARAALGLQQALARYRDELLTGRGIDFRLRLGLNTGLVVVGAIGDNLRMDYTAVGDTTNTAARMQQLAEPGRIVVAEATQRLIGPYFETRALGAVPVKGKSQPVAAYELVGAKAAVSRLEARAARGLSPFVGRDDALATLERAWAQARSGRGQAVFVVGEPGMGKSRLLLEFRQRVGDTATWVEGDCISFGQSIPFLPIVAMLKRNFGIEDHDGEPQIIAKVHRRVELLGAEAATVEALLRYLLAVNPGDPSVVAMDPVQRRARIVAAIQRLTAVGGRRRPVVLVVEDAHWIDSASEDFLKSLTESLPGMAVLLIVTYRPVYQQPFGDRTYYWRIGLQPVAEEDAARFVRGWEGFAEVPRALAATIAGKAEGNPFFLEEIGRTLVETGAVRTENGRLVLAQAVSTISVPETVQDVIAARIDRLAGPQKRTVQTASVIGREFALALLERVSDLQEKLEQNLAELKRIELIYEKAGFGELEYVFKHALTQDVAYASLLQAERRRLHPLIGAAIEEVYAGRLEERAEELAYHFTRGEVWDKVVQYARTAAERAAALCVDDRAVELYQAALDALGRLPESEETSRIGIEVRLAMRAPLWRGGQPDRLFALVKEAEALAARAGQTDHLDTIYAFFVQYHWARGEQDKALEYGQRCLERAEARDDLGLRVTGLFYLGHAYHVLGRYADSVQAARKIMALLEGPKVTERFGLSGLPYSGACAMAAASLGEIGDHAGALALLERGQRVADAANHLYSQIVLAAARGDVLVGAGRAEEAIAALEPAVRVCREKNFVGQLINVLKHLGRAYTLAGRPAEAVAPLRESIELQDKANVFVQRTLKHTALAGAYLALGELEPAAADLERALAFAERLGERSWEGWARLMCGELALRRGDREAAERSFEEAAEIAEECGMMPLLERCRRALRR
ncbi:MAG: AAA family ATPase [Candidatus Rokubacteria bacterium]|nr:AAA family ATPase [Candidatus Rokubacteria bacterium]